MKMQVNLREYRVAILGGLGCAISFDDVLIMRKYCMIGIEPDMESVSWIRTLSLPRKESNLIQEKFEREIYEELEKVRLTQILDSNPNISLIKLDIEEKEIKAFRSPFVEGRQNIKWTILDLDYISKIQARFLLTRFFKFAKARKFLNLMRVQDFQLREIEGFNFHLENIGGTLVEGSK